MKFVELYRTQKNFLAGLLLLSFLICVLSFSYLRKGQSVSSTLLNVYATYNKADGVNIGSEVRLAGIDFIVDNK